MITNINEFKIYENYNNLSNYQKGLLIAWGDRLYLSVHDYPTTMDLPESYIKNIFESLYKYYKTNNEEEYEEIMDWLTEDPPTAYNGKKAISKTWVFNELQKIETPLIQDTIVYRTTNELKPGYSSYTLQDKPYYNNTQHHKFLLPKGFNVVNTFDLADEKELIINLSEQDIQKYKI